MIQLGWWPLRRLRVRGPSMAPALSDGDVVVLRRLPARKPGRCSWWARESRGVRPGDVVLVRWRHRPDQLSVKRAVRRDGSGWHVEGDNPTGSTDSRGLGPAEVLGVIRWRLWPSPGRVPRA